VAGKDVANGSKTFRRRIRLSVNRKAREYYVAALVLEAWVGPRPQGATAKHYDADPLNVELKNLFWGYPQSRIDPVEFVKIWQHSESVREVAERIGKPYQAALATAKRMREHGVNLIPLEQKKITGDDYALLAELAENAQQSSLPMEENDEPEH
jgi:hypothetical protein